MFDCVCEQLVTYVSFGHDACISKPKQHTLFSRYFEKNTEIWERCREIDYEINNIYVSALFENV